MTGTTALVWQTATWRRSQHDVKVRVANAFPVYGNFVGEHHIEVRAINKGSGPVTVTAWGVGVGEGGNAIQVDQRPFSTPVPHRLEGGSDATFFMPADDLRAQHHHRGVPYRKMHAWVRLGTGRTVTARRGLPLKD